MNSHVYHGVNNRFTLYLELPAEVSTGKWKGQSFRAGARRLGIEFGVAEEPGKEALGARYQTHVVDRKHGEMSLLRGERLKSEGRVN
jgi:hypothetical protein